MTAATTFKTRAAIDHAYNDLISDHQRMKEAHEAFKKDAVRVALEAAKEHGWCSEIYGVLEEAGLEVPNQKRRVAVTVFVNVDASEADEILTDDDEFEQKALEMVNDHLPGYSGEFDVDEAKVVDNV